MTTMFELSVLVDLVDRLTGPVRAGPMAALQGLQQQAERTQAGLDQMASGAGVLAAGGMIAFPLVQAFNAASDLNETLSKTNVVFGQSAQEITSWANTSAKAMGFSRQQALENASTLGNLFVSMKIGSSQASQMSRSMVQLAADFASFNNVGTQQAYDAIRSGLVGETEPLRAFGVNLDDNSLKVKAFQMGLTKKVKVDTLAPAIKAQAAYALILDQSKTAQGDYARTASGAANTTRTLTAQVGDLRATIGQQLLPTGLALLQWLSRSITKMQQFADAHPNVTKALVLLGVTLVATLGILGLLIVTFGLVNVAVAQTTMGLTMLRGGMAATGAHATGLAASLVRLGAGARSANLAQQLRLESTAVGMQRLSLALTGVRVAFVGATQAAWAMIAPLLANPITWIVLAVVALGAAFVAAWRSSAKFRDSVVQAMQPVRDAVAELRAAFSKLLDTLGPIGQRIGAFFTSVFGSWDTFVGQMLYGIGFFLGFTLTVFTRVFGEIAGRVVRALGGIVEFLTGVINIIVGLFTGDLDKVRLGAEQVWSGVRTVFLAAFDWLLDLGTKSWNAGRDFVLGWVNGVKSNAARAVDVVKDVARSAWEGFKNFWGIKSPSRLMATGGEDMMRGLALGVGRQENPILQTVKGVLGRIWAGAKSVIGLGGTGTSTSGVSVGGQVTAPKLPPAAFTGVQSNTIVKTGMNALTSAWAESAPGFCSRFVRQVFDKAFGGRFQRLFGASAIETEKLWQQAGLTKSLQQLGGMQGLKAGDVLFQGFGSGGYGHTGIYAGNGMVMENSTRGAGGKMMTPIANWGAITSVGRLPSQDEDDAPTVRGTTKDKTGTTHHWNITLPNVREPGDFATAWRELLEGHK